MDWGTAAWRRQPGIDGNKVANQEDGSSARSKANARTSAWWTAEGWWTTDSGRDWEFMNETTSDSGWQVASSRREEDAEDPWGAKAAIINEKTGELNIGNVDWVPNVKISRGHGRTQQREGAQENDAKEETQSIEAST